MISIQAKKHDNYSVEFKFGFNCNEGIESDEFAVNAWIFVPNSLGVNAETMQDLEELLLQNDDIRKIIEE